MVSPESRVVARDETLGTGESFGSGHGQNRAWMDLSGTWTHLEVWRDYLRSERSRGLSWWRYSASRNAQTCEGTNQIQRVVIAKHLLT